MAISGELVEEMMRALEDIKAIPLKVSVSVSIAASGSGTATITVPSGWRYYIKSWAITKGTDVTVSSITIDDNDTFQIVDVSDTVAKYGRLLLADSIIKISGSNAGTGAESLAIEIWGYKDEINK